MEKNQPVLMKNILLVIMMIVTLAYGANDHYMLAVVNKTPITLKDYQLSAKVKSFISNQPFDETSTVDSELLTFLIDRLLLIQTIEELPDDDIADFDVFIENIKDEKQLSDSQFEQKLSDAGLTIDNIKYEIEQQLLMQIAMSKIQAEQITVDEKELQHWIIQNSTFSLLDLHFQKEPTQKEREEIEAKLQQKLNIDTELQAYQSDAIVDQKPTHQKIIYDDIESDYNLKITMYDQKKPTELPRLFEQALVYCQPMQLSHIFQAPNGPHMLFIHQLHQIPSNEVAYQVIFREKAESNIDSIIQTLRDQAYIKLRETKT